ncbi:MAG: sel1 repeat family protein [Betaproteobacteria bacterium]|nr:sel1 repeat family protein [Betaproteobacteria bacterium]
MSVKRVCSAGLLAMVVAGGVGAGDWEDGYADYQRRDFPAAVKKWRNVAEAGNPNAQSLLGEMYAFGQGVPLNYPEAIRWLRMAAAQGVAKAHYKLGSMYEKGHGFEKNPAMAYRWYSLADAAGHPEAYKDRKRLAAKLDAKVLQDSERWVDACVKRLYTGCE